jgi:hypothetical protein
MIGFIYKILGSENYVLSLLIRFFSPFFILNIILL